MTRARAVLAAAAMAAGLLAAPAGAAPGDELVLRGSRTAWVDVTVTGDGLDVWDVTIETRGRFGGFYAEQLTSTVGEPQEGMAAGYVALRDLAATGAPPRPLLLGDTIRLTGGRVRFYLVADGPTTVRIDTHGGWTAALRPTRRTTATVAAARLARAGDAWERAATLAVGRRAVVVAGLLVDASGSVAADPEVCVGYRGGCPDDLMGDLDLRLSGNSADPGAVIGHAEDERLWWVRHLPGTVDSGRQPVRFGVAHLAEVRRAVGAAFALTLA